MNNKRGFTLIELVIVAVVVSILAAVLAPLALSSLRAYDETLKDLIVLDKLRYSTERLAREIREVNWDKTNGFAFTAQTGSLAFTRSLWDSSGNLNTAVPVIICYSGSTVSLNYSSSCTGANTLTDQFNALSFAFYDKDGKGTAVATAIRSVQISLTLQKSSTGPFYSQRTRVELKNYDNS